MYFPDRLTPGGYAAGLAGALVLSLVAPGMSAWAQTGAGDAPEETEEILITGTRIQGLDLAGAVQAVQVNREDMLESGAENIGELMQDLPITGGGTGTFTTSTAGPLSSDTPVGASGVSLRGLGTGSTLTLINGRRATISSFARGQESFIDVNSIPLAALERVEILPNGASATYGADAVAGVVNYVLRKDYEGVEVSGSYGDSWDYTFAEASWWHDRYYVEFSYDLVLAFGLRAPFSVDVHSYP